MSMEDARKFLNEVKQNEKLVEMLNECSLEDLKTAITEMDLEGVAGGCFYG